MLGPVLTTELGTESSSCPCLGPGLCRARGMSGAVTDSMAWGPMPPQDHMLASAICTLGTWLVCRPACCKLPWSKCLTFPSSSMAPGLVHCMFEGSVTSPLCTRCCSEVDKSGISGQGNVKFTVSDVLAVPFAHRAATSEHNLCCPCHLPEAL